MFRTLCLALTAIMLAACGHTPVTRTLMAALGKGQSVDAINLNPNLRYLRVTVRERVVLMVLGYVDSAPDGALETWYSAEGEVLRLKNGRVVGTVGLETDWRAVRNASPPAWKEVLAASPASPVPSVASRGSPGAATLGNPRQAPLVYQRERDEMPGYRFGINETVRLYPVRTPNNAPLVGLSANELRWYEEAVQGAPGGLPSARYGLRMQETEPRVMYGEQCLSTTFCLAWQVWPAK